MSEEPPAIEPFFDSSQPAPATQSAPTAAAPQPRPAQPATPAPKPQMPLKTVSIRPNTVQEPQAVYAKSEPLQTEDKLFTLNELTEAWQAYAHTIPEKIHLVNAMLGASLLMQSATEFEATIENSIQEKGLYEEKPDILAYLAQKLQNSQVNFVIKVTESTQAKGLTEQERLEEMTRKNPAFARLRSELKLGI